jgi:hypothetical protein
LVFIPERVEKGASILSEMLGQAGRFLLFSSKKNPLAAEQLRSEEGYGEQVITERRILEDRAAHQAGAVLSRIG